jgi:hypothetical protein
LHLGGVRHLRFGRCGRCRIYQLCFAAITRYRRMVDDLAT